jgi:hypothetical protein
MLPCYPGLNTIYSEEELERVRKAYLAEESVANITAVMQTNDRSSPHHHNHLIHAMGGLVKNLSQHIKPVN